MYERFHIGTKPSPLAYTLPAKFDVQARKLRLAAMLVHEAFEFRFKKDVVLSRPCIYGVFGGRFGGFKPIKEKCVGCMRCVQEYPHIMTVKLSEPYKRLGDSYWTPDSIFTILYEASTGKIPVKGMGYKGSFGGEGFDDMWTDMSEIVRPTRDGVYGREYISTVVDIGRKPQSLEFGRDNVLGAVETVPVPIPIIFDLPLGSNEQVLRAASSAAAELKTFSVAPLGDSSGEPSTNNVPFISGKNDAEGRAEFLKKSRIIEYDPDKPGLRNKLREKTRSVIFAARLPLDDEIEEVALQLVREGVEALHVYADYHGMDYSRSPRHIARALKTLHGRLVKEKVRDQVTIIASGGITLAEHVPKAVICGADLVAVDTSLLVALQAEFQGETRSRTDCKLNPRAIDPAWGSQRIVNLMASWHDQLVEILSAMGIRDVRRLRGDVGRSMLDSELREQAFEGMPWATV